MRERETKVLDLPPVALTITQHWSPLSVELCRRRGIAYSWSAFLLIAGAASARTSVQETLETGDGGVAVCRPITKLRIKMNARPIGYTIS